MFKQKHMQNLQILIPMAGAGSRFANEWYTDPKPLIPIDGTPMIVKVMDSLPEAEKYIFVCRQEHLAQYGIDKVIKESYPNAVFHAIDYLTEGQASTCLLGEAYCDPNKPLLIAACDNGMLYEDFDAYVANHPEFDSLMWTFSEYESLRTNPKAWGWVKVKPNSIEVEDLSIKIPVSEDPFHDQAVVATFWFKKAGDFFDAARLMIEKNIRINNEFYVDTIPLALNMMGKKSGIFEIDKYIGRGTPADLRRYNYYRCVYEGREPSGDIGGIEFSQETYDYYKGIFEGMKAREKQK